MLLLQAQQPIWAVIGFIASLIIVLLLQVGFCGYYLTDVSWLGRAIAIVGAALLMFTIAMQMYITFALGMIIIILLTLQQLRQRGLVRPA